MSTPGGQGTAVLDRSAAGIVRVVPLPRVEPPIEDEQAAHDRPDMAAPTLPLRLPRANLEAARPTIPNRASGLYSPVTAVRGGRPRTPRRRTASADRPPVDRRGHGGTGATGLGGRPAGEEPEPAPAALPEVRVATMRFISTFLEVTAGFRPLSHLRQHCRPDRFERIADHLRGRPTGRTTPGSRGAAALSGRVLIVGGTPAAASPLTGRVAPRPNGDRLTLRRVQICQVSQTVAEVVAVLGRRTASAAMALRMEKVHDRWLCVHLEIV